ncbi:MAG: hypothetical protein ACFB6S_13970 [Geminicoccaceae bacterium]
MVTGSASLMSFLVLAAIVAIPVWALARRRNVGETGPAAASADAQDLERLALGLDRMERRLDSVERIIGTGATETRDQGRAWER